MAKDHIPSPELLRQLLEYDAESGGLFWKERGPDFFNLASQRNREGAARTWNARMAGKRADTVTLSKQSPGYRYVVIFAKKYSAHRVAWAIQTGSWPKEQIDHINGERGNNRLDNLRDVPQFLNSRNAAVNKRNPSGVVGVSRCPQCPNVWLASIYIFNRKIHLGRFDTKEEAVAARKAAEKVAGFHPNHGRTSVKAQL